MKTLHTTAEWHRPSFEFRVGETEYVVNAHVFVQFHHIDNSGNYGPRTDIEVDAELDGWNCDPEPPAEHLPRLEELLRNALEEKEWI